MKTFLALSLTTLYGVCLRLIFGLQGDILEIMSLSFLILGPMMVGFLTVFLMPARYTNSLVAAFFIPWVTSILILIVTIAVEMEGIICWIMIFPIFALLAGVGGIIAYNLRDSINKKRKTRNLNISVLVLLPILAGLAEGERSLTPKHYTISESITIHASKERVWNELTDLGQIEVQENKLSLPHILGFPKHLKTSIDSLQVGGHRLAIYEKGLYFDEVISSFEIEKSLVLDVKTDPESIPAKVMDEHIIIGGKHVDILQDKYEITALNDQTCTLSLSSTFFINTPFNWYSGIWSKYLMSDILRSELQIIEQRATQN